MKIKLVNNLDNKYSLKVFLCSEDDVCFETDELLKKIKYNKIFEGKKGTRYSLTKNVGNDIEILHFIGVGKKERVSYDSLYKELISGFNSIKMCKFENVLIHSTEFTSIDHRDVLRAIILSLNSVNYKFDKYKSNKEDKNLNIDIYDECNCDITEFLNIANALNLTRDLVNEPANVITPEEFSKRCLESVKNLDIEIEVYDENWIKENNLMALYEVGKASSNKPRFIVMKYFGNKDNDKTISFVGKGLTYDSGGYSIKTTNGMVTMKCDMAGAASVLSLITLVARQKLNINIYAVIPTCENMVNGNGFKPGDVIQSLAGKTIEVISTDAEGRLVLADGVYYAATNLNSDMIIDVATLTGACGIALGTKYAAVIDNNQDIFDKLMDAGKNTVDSIWRLPGDKEYLETLKSDIADYKNIGGRYGGTITAGLFVGEFVNNKPWAHIDIAYVAWNDSSTNIFPHKGGTGAVVELLYNFCKNNQ